MVTDDKLFGCPYCGFRVDPGEDLCSRCGNAFGSGTKFECPFCGDLVAPGMDECPSCHINFTEFQTHVKKTAKTDSMDTLLMDIIELEAGNVEKEGKKFSCPTCDLLLNGSETECPRCRMDLTEGATFQCPTCGEFVDPSAEKCPECGAMFEVGEPASDEDKSAAEHEKVATALDEILTAAGHTGPLPEIEREPVTIELPHPPEPEKEIEPETVPTPPPSPEPEPAQVSQSPEPPKKPRVRKLKTKTSSVMVKPPNEG